MITNQERDIINSIISKAEPADYFILDTTELSTALDAGTALYLICLHQYFISIYGAIGDLYTFDVTGCLDSGLL